MSTETVNTSDSVSGDFDMPAPGSPGYDEFRKTGKLPDREEVVPKKEEETETQIQEHEPSEKEAESAAAKPAVTRPDSASGKPQGRKSGDQRFQELANRNRELLERLEKLEKGQTPEKREPAVSQAAPEKKAKPKLSDNDPKTGKPFTSIEEWSEAVDQWNDERINGVLEDRLGRERQAFQQTETQRIIAAETQRRSEPAMKKYPDFIQTVTNPKLLIPAGSTVERFLLNPNTKNVGEISYHLGKHPEILEDFYQWEGTLEKGSYKDKIDPIEQLRILMEIEREFEAEPEKKAPARTITQAPRPPHQVSGKPPAPDSLAKAVEDGDQETFTRLENERLLAARKSQRR